MNLSLAAQRTIYQQETGDYPIILLIIDHDDLTEPIRISSDWTQRLGSVGDQQITIGGQVLTIGGTPLTVSGGEGEGEYFSEENVIYGTVHLGNDYIYFPADIHWPTEEEGSPPQTQITVSNIGGELVSMLRTLISSPTLTMRLILASDLDQIEGEFSGFVLSEVDISALTITGSLTIDTGANEPFPHRTFTPSTAAGLFKA